MKGDLPLEIECLGSFISLPKKKIKALSNINLEIRKGEFFGIVGRNGSGKSTLLHIMSGAYQPDPGGKSELKGKYMRLALGLGFDPELTARENVYLNGAILGISMKQIGRKFSSIIEFAELQDFADTKLKYFSSGMVTKLKFSVAVNAEADIFLMDEFFGGVGDLRFKSKSEKVFEESIVKGRTIVHVSHSLNTIRKHCTRVLLLDKGKMIMVGEPDEVLEKYKQIVKK